MAVEAVFGGEVIWHSEIDKAASKVLAHRWPEVPNLGSITEIDWATVKPVDVLCGGFPCQDVSSAGKNAGIKDGTRSGLWAIFAEAIDQLRPQFVVIENVRGLLSATAHRAVESDDTVVGDRSDRPVLRALGAVLGDLSDIGYDARWTTVAASAVGAPHRRERVFIVGTPAYTGHGAAILRVEEGTERPDYSTTKARRGGDEPGVALLPTPAAGNFNDGEEAEQWLARQAAVKERLKNGNGMGMPLAIAVQLLPTPSTHEKTGARSPESIARMDKPFANLNDTFVNELGVERGPEPVDVSVGEDDSSVPVLPGNGGGEDALIGAADGDGVAVDVCGAENSHSSCVPAELAGTKHLLPTPNASDGSGGGQHPDKREGHSRQLIDYVLLCTPTAQPGSSRSGDRIGEPLLRQQAREMEMSWGKYAPAIARWEQIVGPAPAPTEPNKNNNPRLSAAFSEWLMGWPAGWVTDPDLGISRNDQLRIVGNGVCTQQAIAALRYLLAVTA